MALNEFDLIEKYFQQRQPGAFGVSLGIGDDCALLMPPAGKALATTIDTLVAGNHFPENADPELIAERALRVNLSDMAAMGGEALWFTLALTLPSADAPWLDGFARGLFQAASEFHCALVGGDTTRGPLSITIQVMGAVELNQALLRGNARPGDLVYVTGTLGDAAAAVAVIRNRLKVGKAAFAYLMSHYYRPLPRLKEGQMLAGIASAAIDVSDGLLADLGHICKSSGVGALIDWERVPVSEALAKVARPEQVREWALSGGDDYQLCFTVPPAQALHVEQMVSQKRLSASQIGEIVRGEGVSCRYKGRPIALGKTGYQHFDIDTET
ncbi:thiamine-phosphate kinase [Proteobacteria bacterium 005FR1]|nr:thiamine-phosphate kinase [Proteobacteria bacterium 005FR1]